MGNLSAVKINDLIHSPIHDYLNELIERFRNDQTGSLANYIPELAKADKNWFGIALVTVDGHIYPVGDSWHPFTIQSISKPFTYALTLDIHGADYTLGKVGVEPSGEAFNEISLEQVTGRPFNPMINAGAIATTGLVHGETPEERFKKILNCYEKFAARELELDEGVYRSESETGNRNRAIAYLLRNSNIIEDKTEETLDLYFRQCSILVNCRDLAVMGATLANNGINPITGVVAMKPGNVEKVLSIMSTCGMYDYAGGWIYDVGMPAKSGVAGGIMAVLPGQCGIGVFSPLLDQQGNSARGIEVCHRISMDFGLHMFDSSKASNSVIRAKYDTTTITSKRRRTTEEFNILRTHGGRIKVYELAGDLIFSATDYVLQTIMSELEKTDYIIFDFKRVTSAKKSAGKLIASLVKLVRSNSKHVFFTNTDYQFTKLLSACLDRETYNDTIKFSENDLALEWCENNLIHQYIGPTDISCKVTLNGQMLLKDFSGHELKTLKSFMQKRTFNKGEFILKEGDDSDALYFLTVGEVSIKMRSSKNNHLKRISTLSAGMSFGEMSVLDKQVRSASVIAESYVECYELSFAIFDNELTALPELKNKLVISIAMDLANKLRKVNQEIRAYQ